MNTKITKISELKEIAKTDGIFIDAFNRLGKCYDSIKDELMKFAESYDGYYSGRHIRSIHLKQRRMFVRMSHFTSPEKIVKFNAEVKFSRIKSSDGNFSGTRDLDTSKLDEVIKYECPITGKYF